VAAGIRDRFANIARFTVTESAANTLTFSSLQTNMGFIGRRDQALAMVIDEIQYSPNFAMLQDLDVEGDAITMGITDSELVTDLSDLNDQRVLDFQSLSILVVGAATSIAIVGTPFRKQFFPPLITAARQLFFGLAGLSLAAAGTARSRILYRVETLTAAELVELSEVFRLTG